MSKKIPDITRRMSINFAKELDDIKLERIKMRTDRKMMGDTRLTEAMIKQPEWQSLKVKLARLPRNPRLDKRGRFR